MTWNPIEQNIEIVHIMFAKKKGDTKPIEQNIEIIQMVLWLHRRRMTWDPIEQNIEIVQIMF